MDNGKDTDFFSGSRFCMTYVSACLEDDDDVVRRVVLGFLAKCFRLAMIEAGTAPRFSSLQSPRLWPVVAESSWVLGPALH
jgi:hypothetical protein